MKADDASADDDGWYGNFRHWLRVLYHGPAVYAQRFRLTLIVVDLLIIAFVIATSFVQMPPMIEDGVLVIIAVYVIIDLVARTLATGLGLRLFTDPSIIADIIVAGALLVPALWPEAAFLRALRTLALLRSHRVIRDLQVSLPWLRRNEEAVTAGLNLAIFVFLMTGLVYALEHQHNAKISNYVDALYFTLSTLTTTGFGDIVLTGTLGRGVAVLIMLFGVGFFLRLVQTIFSPSRVMIQCGSCGLSRHEADASHCRQCGAVLGRHIAPAESVESKP